MLLWFIPLAVPSASGYPGFTPHLPFVHLLSQDGRVVAQYDGFDVVVADLAPGGTVVQMHTLQLPADLAVSPYRLELGAYLRADLGRIPLSTGTEHVNLESWQPTQ